MNDIEHCRPCRNQTDFAEQAHPSKMKKPHLCGTPTLPPSLRQRTPAKWVSQQPGAFGSAQGNHCSSSSTQPACTCLLYLASKAARGHSQSLKPRAQSYTWSTPRTQRPMPHQCLCSIALSGRSSSGGMSLSVVVPFQTSMARDPRDVTSQTRVSVRSGAMQSISLEHTGTLVMAELQSMVWSGMMPRAAMKPHGDGPSLSAGHPHLSVQEYGLRRNILLSIAGLWLFVLFFRSLDHHAPRAAACRHVEAPGCHHLGASQWALSALGRPEELPHQILSSAHGVCSKQQ